MSGNFRKSDPLNSKALVRQDSCTSVQTTSAQSRTVNTTTMTRTNFNSVRNTFEMSVTKQTVSREENVGIVVKSRVYTPTKAEIESMKINETVTTTETARGKLPGFNSWKTNESSKYQNKPNDKPSTSNSTAGKGMGSFKESVLTQSQHQSVTSHSEERRINLKNSSKPSGFSTGATAKSYVSPYKKNENGTYKPSVETGKYMGKDSKCFSPPSTGTTSSSFASQNASAPYISLRNSNQISEKPAYAPASTTYRGVFATPSSKSSFKMEGNAKNFKPGCAYIFSNDKFDEDKNATRHGNEYDVANLKETFKYLQLKVELHENLSLTKIREIAKKLKEKDFKERSCIVIVILSHGNKNGEVSAKDKTYNIDNELLYPLLHNKSLEDKPKIFFIQACRGSYVEAPQKDMTLLPPNKLLKCYSSFEGFASYRNPTIGTYFIRELCDLLKNKGKTVDIRKIIDNVINEVIIKTKKDGFTQTPSYTVTNFDDYVFGDYMK